MSHTPNIWSIAQTWEGQWWGNCVNTYGEETKQLLYANRMGLQRFHNGKSPFNFDLNNISVLDIGGGPCSLLLKCVNFGRAKVIDPLQFPQWVLDRYEAADIEFERVPGELLDEPVCFDEVWMYNVLQHTNDPEKCIFNAFKYGHFIRIFEWIDTVTNVGHPYAFSEDQLNKWLKGEGKVETLQGEASCYGRCYYGVFVT